MELLDAYKRTMDYTYIQRVNALDCQCHEAWRRRIRSTPETPLRERVAEGYRALAIQVMGAHWWERRGAGLLEEDSSLRTR